MSVDVNGDEHDPIGTFIFILIVLYVLLKIFGVAS